MPSVEWTQQKYVIALQSCVNRIQLFEAPELLDFFSNEFLDRSKERGPKLVT